MVRTLIALLAVLAAPGPAQDAGDPPPSVEAMLARARKEASGRRKWLEARVDALLTKLRKSFILGSSDDLKARADLHGLGSAAVPILVDRFGSEIGERTLREIGLAIGTIMTEKNTAVIESVRAYLGGKSSLRARLAVELLGYIGDDAAAADLVPIARDSADDDLRAAALVALSRLDPKGTDADIFRTAMRSAGPSVRAGAVAGLAARADGADLDVVLKGLEDSDESVIIAVIKSLPAWGDKAARPLHPMLSHSSERVVTASLESLARVGSKEISGRHLKAVVTDEDRDYEIRRHAAKVMFDLGDRAGLKELAEPLKKQINKRPRKALYKDLGQLYWEFGDYKNAASYLGKSLEEKENAESRAINETIARCYARMRLFKKAKDHLQKSGRSMFWADLADDADFAEMRKDRKWQKYFEN